ncbi:hypothetical protein [Microvirga mediterraneensis]|uniref:Polymerase nucleotidyl transferase domain-containing protein n=1 Tax=Microvirga mediterraneensis TaxID=2754695 RepID=A0A838BW80_9HYPH|nr:hypothetical protein [Microvirga mediterraneensis]MBA1159362.1 hypothetical protein [Microvirga mediterraneensis]
MKPANFSPVYCALYPEFAEITRQHGYALAIHGSLSRDMDLICIPWVDEPSEPRTVIDALISTFAIKEVGTTETRAHGREVHTLSIGFGECAVDLSFMPRRLTQNKENQNV